MSTRRRLILVALVLMAIDAAWLLSTREPSLEVRRLFGLWRTRHLLVAGLLAWSTALILLRAASPGALGRGLLVSASVGLGWLVLELAGVVGLVSYPRLFGYQTADALGAKPVPNVDIRGRAPGDIGAAWGVPAEEIEFRYTTDRRGFRNAVDRDAADLYLLGDSVLVAGLVPFEQTLPARLEAALGVPVMNLSLLGLSPQEVRDLFLAADLPVEGRVVIQFLFEGNDLEDSATFRHRGEGPTSDSRDSIVNRTLARNLERWLFVRTQPVHPFAHRFSGEVAGRPYYFLWSAHTMRGHDDELPHIGDALAELRDRVVAAGGRYAVVLVPSKLRVLGPLADWPPGSDLTAYREHLSPLPEFLAAWGRERAVPVLDSTAAFAASAGSGDIPFFAADTHPNGAGHAALARAIQEWDEIHPWLEAAQRRD